MELRYMGFDQHGNTRAYKFDGVEQGRLIARLVVTADLTLFLKHHLSIQDGPTLCVRKLTTDATQLGQHDHQLTEGDLLSFMTTRADQVVLSLVPELAAVPRDVARFIKNERMRGTWEYCRKGAISCLVLLWCSALPYGVGRSAS